MNCTTLTLVWVETANLTDWLGNHHPPGSQHPQLPGVEEIRGLLFVHLFMNSSHTVFVCLFDSQRISLSRSPRSRMTDCSRTFNDVQCSWTVYKRSGQFMYAHEPSWTAHEQITMLIANRFLCIYGWMIRLWFLIKRKQGAHDRQTCSKSDNVTFVVKSVPIA